jgi:hypothetical protein
MRLFPIPFAAVQYVTCLCSRVSHVVDGVAVCEVCQLQHTPSVETRLTPAAQAAADAAAAAEAEAAAKAAAKLPKCACWSTGAFIWVEGCPGHPRESVT